MAEDNSLIGLATPTRFLIENGEWNLTPSITGSIQHEINPFDDCNYQQRYAPMKTAGTPILKWMSSPVATPHTLPPPPPPTSIVATTTTTTGIFKSPESEVALMNSPLTPPMSLSQSPTSTSTASFTMAPTVGMLPTVDCRHNTLNTRNTKSRTTSFDKMDDYAQSAVQIGRKRSIVFEGDDAEDRRKQFLERNRVAAYKCRQKKKNWMQDLEQKAELKSNQNEELKSLVAVLKEESMYLRNLLLTHGNCNCDSVQAYLRKQSAEITMPSSSSLSKRNSAVSMPVPYNPSTATTMPSFSEESSTGLTPFLNTVINKAPQDSSDYFVASHTVA